MSWNANKGVLFAGVTVCGLELSAIKSSKTADCAGSAPPLYAHGHNTPSLRRLLHRRSIAAGTSKAEVARTIAMLRTADIIVHLTSNSRKKTI
jgi:hypothetical protein